MGSSGKSTRTVYDFLMSIDYGVSAGPVDSLNKIWVKDRTVFCGKIQDRTDIQVNLPDLFGGDDGEGGTVGVIEAYLGYPDQVVSGQLAARNGLFPDSHPGYRGIFHLFFRGTALVTDDDVTDIAVDADGNVVPVEDEFLNGSPDSVVGRGLQPIVGLALNRLQFITNTLFDALRAGRTALSGGVGFRWTSNNPYLPTTRVHATRVLNMGLDQQWAFIYPVKEIDDNGVPQPYSNFLFTPDPVLFGVDYFDDFADGSINLTDHFTVDQIDSGKLVANGRISATCILRGGLAGDGPANASIEISVFFLDENEAVIPAPSFIATGAGSGDIVGEGDRPIPAGTRTIVINSRFFPAVVSASTILNRETQIWIEYVTDGGGGSGFAALLSGTVESHCNPDGGGLRSMPNANPAHIIYEAMTNPVWGMGESTSAFNTASFESAAQTLHSEFMGLFIKWVQQGKVEDLISEVIDHIDAVLYQDPATGLWNLRLLRDDYDASLQPLLSPSNCVAKNQKRRAWGETVNEIVVKWTDPETEKLASVSAHNLSNIAVQGGVVSETRTYYGIRDEIVAQRIADRDVATAGYPLFTAEITVNRSDWRVVPGDIRRFSWPEDGIDNIVLRVLEVDRGKKNSRKIKLSVIEDIFSVSDTAYTNPQRGFWSGPLEVPVAFDAEVAVDVPLPALMRNGASVANVDAAYPETSVVLLGENDNLPVIDFDAVTEVVRANGTVALETILTAPDTRSLLTGGPIFAQSFTLLSGSFVQELTLDNAQEGDLLLLGPDAAGDQEIIMLDSYDGATGAWTVARGVWDTVPRAWPSGTRIWNFSTDPVRVDPEPRVSGTEVSYRLLPRTVAGRLDQSEAEDLVHTVSERPFLPFRPANTQLDGNGFEKLEYSDHDTRPTGMTATWDTRNRETEDRLALRWSDPSVTPETGQTTLLRVFDLDDVLLVEYGPLTGVSHFIPFGDLLGEKNGYVSFYSVNAFGESLWASKREWSIQGRGYGNNYGNNYGSI